PSADQWSLGRLLFRCAAGGRARSTSSGSKDSFRTRLEKGALIDWSEFPPAREWGELRAVIGRMLADTPELRYANVAEVERALANLGRAPALPAGLARG